MNAASLLWYVSILLLPLTLGFQEIGRRLGRWRLSQDPEGARAGATAVEGAVFALFGLLIAFTFNNAANRFETRRNLIVEHTNAIGAAWMRLDLLPADVQSDLRQDFRLYVDGMIEFNQQAGDPRVVEKITARLGTLQDEIWKLAETAVSRDSRPQVAKLMLPALNEMFNLGASRFVEARFHLSLVIISFLIFLALLASLLVGHAMAAAKGRNWFYMILFSLLVSLTLYIILDFEFPRYGFIRLDKADKIYLELRQAMQ